MDGSLSYNRTYYRDTCRCFVPSCLKYRRDFPNLRFLRLPNCLLAVWCQAVKRNCPTKQSLYVCEEHINMEQDSYKGRYGKLHLKKTANLVLTKTYFEIQNQDNETCETQDEDISKVLPSTSRHCESMVDLKCDSSTQCQLDRTNKAVSARPAVRSVGCSAKITHEGEKIMPSLPSSKTASSSSTPSLYEPSSRSSSSTCIENMTEGKDRSGRIHILKLVKENPKMYIGVPQQFYWMIDFLSKQCKLRPLHIIVTFFKIKQNDTILRMCHHFNISKGTVQELLKICMPHLATYMQIFIFLPEPNLIKKALPAAFKARYANVQCIIDCFEIHIEKPSNPLKQARTWSQYKACNTVKYLVACCPNGFVCFISKGYGGRISDKAITESSGFMDILPPGAVVLADRGFKGIETLLTEREVKLLRPPSVSSNNTPTKTDVIQGKVIASLRIHVERVIRRLREYSFLKPHSVINHSHVRYVDDAVIIACALVNLQSNIIKME